MIKLEQIRELNEKVQSTLEVVRLLREENTVLRGKLTENEGRVKELEVLVSSFRNDQDEIEDGIKGILLQLDRLEEEFTAPPTPRSDVEKVTEKPSSEEDNDGTTAPEAENASVGQESSNSPVEPVSSPMESNTAPEEVAVLSEESSEENTLVSSDEDASDKAEVEQSGVTEEVIPPTENPVAHTASVEPETTENVVQPSASAETMAEVETPAADAAVSELDIF